MLRTKLILGTVQLGLDYGINNSSGKPDETEAFSILEEAGKNQIKYLDTAAAYGTSEKIIGEFQRNNPHSFEINTKLSLGNNSISEIVEERLRVLNCQNLNILFFHKFNDLVNIRDSEINEFKTLKSLNKIRKLGVSIYTNEEFKFAIESEYIDVIQIPYNLLDCDREKSELINQAKISGKEIHARSIYLQGLFFMSLDSVPSKFKDLLPDLERINNLSKETGYTLQELALNFVLSNPQIDFVLFGSETIRQLRENIMQVKVDFPSEIRLQILKFSNYSPLLNPLNWNA